MSLLIIQFQKKNTIDAIVVFSFLSTTYYYFYSLPSTHKLSRCPLTSPPALSTHIRSHKLHRLGLHPLY
jgi:hypothetical protein